MGAAEIIPIRQDHIDGFHRTLDIVARERRYLAFLEGPPIETEGVQRDAVYVDGGYENIVCMAILL